MSSNTLLVIDHNYHFWGKKCIYGYSPGEFLQHNVIYLAMPLRLLPLSLAILELTEDLIENYSILSII